MSGLDLVDATGSEDLDDTGSLNDHNCLVENLLDKVSSIAE